MVLLSFPQAGLWPPRGIYPSRDLRSWASRQVVVWPRCDFAAATLLLGAEVCGEPTAAQFLLPGRQAPGALAGLPYSSVGTSHHSGPFPQSLSFLIIFFWLLWPQGQRTSTGARTSTFQGQQSLWFSHVEPPAHPDFRLIPLQAVSSLCPPASLLNSVLGSCGAQRLWASFINPPGPLRPGDLILLPPSR